MRARTMLVAVALAVGATAAGAGPAAALDAGLETATFAKLQERPTLAPSSQPLGRPSQALRFVNRNGATLSAHLWLPPKDPGGRLPTVVFVNGDLAPEQYYWFAAAAFARAGYLVFTFDPQGHGDSDLLGAGADSARHVAVQQGAESGLVEAAADADAVEQTQDALAFLLSTARRPYLPPAADGTPAVAGHPSSPGQLKQVAGVAARTAAAANPLWSRVNRGRIGLVGHSRGADVASILAARDPRIRAAVAWDDLLAQTADDPPQPLTPKVPVLGISDDYGQVPVPFLSDPDPQTHSAGYRAARAAGVDTGELVLRGASHYEFSYAAGVPLPATLRGADFATWYATAWLDRYVKGDAAAMPRLLTSRWRSDPAAAAADPRHDGNLFSFRFRSRLLVRRPSVLVGHGRRRHRRPGVLVQCDDLRAGCANLVRRGGDGGPERYVVLDPEP